jgi:hypothetical protein
MSKSKEELVKPFTEVDMKTRRGKLREIVAWVLLVVSISFFAFMALVAIS